jgi:PAS domain-containing protein
VAAGLVLAAVTRPQKQLVLILARAFASNLSTPTLLTDASGRLVFYNEAAEAVIGRRFSETGEMPIDDWLTAFDRRTPAGDPLLPERGPTRIALDERRPVHLSYVATSADGVEREIEVSAFPLFAHTDELVGAIVVFWRR